LNDTSDIERITGGTYFSVSKVPVDLLRLDHEVDHLPQGKLKIHLAEVENPPEILKDRVFN